MEIEWIYGLVGGMLIGLSATLLLLFNGKVTGISGIIFGIINPSRKDFSWRLSLIIGLMLAGLAFVLMSPQGFTSTIERPTPIIALAGLLVGFGAKMGNGCTSGHGVCGISRFSTRSLVATCCFIASGALSVLIANYFFGA